MSELSVTVHAFGPMLFREARPFGATGDESRATSLELPLPTTLAGLARTTFGNAAGFTWDADDVRLAQRLRIASYGFAVQHGDGRLTEVAPAPACVSIVVRDGRPLLDDLKPWDAMPRDAGCTLPDGMRPLRVLGQEKPEQVSRWWVRPSVDAWLAASLPGLPCTVAPPLSEQRVQIGTEKGTWHGAEGMLFTVDYRLWESTTMDDEPVRWVARMKVILPDGMDVPKNGSQAGVFGGERRPVTVAWSPAEPDTPVDDGITWDDTRRVKLYLRTPALFAGGWRPGWVDAPERLHSGLGGARLVGAAVGRPQPVSGWSLERDTFGPKGTRWAAPAGSVYFFELARPLSSADAQELQQLTVCDTELDDGIGYGQARWGTWE